MRTFVKKIYRAALFLAFALVLGFTLLVFLERPDTKRKQTEPVDPMPIVEKEIEPAESYSDEIDLLKTELSQIDSNPPEGAVIESENVVSIAESQSLEIEPPLTEPIIVEPDDTTVVVDESLIEELTYLFIGDSRTVGLANYASIENADFFSTIGMSVYNIPDARVPVPQIGKVTLEELLHYKQYDIIYVMLGINELGYAFDQTVARYGDLVDSVMTSQPNAVVILMGNIHVTSERSKTDKYINNPAINRFNEATAELADNKTVFYLDANILFDDEDGSLAAEKSSDSAHLKAKYYVPWADWLEVKTAEIILQAKEE